MTCPSSRSIILPLSLTDEEWSELNHKATERVSRVKEDSRVLLAAEEADGAENINSERKIGRKGRGRKRA